MKINPINSRAIEEIKDKDQNVILIKFWINNQLLLV